MITVISVLGLLFLMTTSQPADSQGAEDFIKLFRGFAQSALSQQATKKVWNQLKSVERACINRALQSEGGSIEKLIRGGIGPFDPRLSDIRASCQVPHPETNQTINQRSPYIVDGLALGEPVNFSSKAYRAYHCTKSHQFEGFTWCERTRQEWRDKKKVSISNSILHDPAGGTAYINQFINPAFFNKEELQQEVDRLTQKFGKKPHRLDIPQREGFPTAVIVSWGEVELVPIDDKAASALAAGDSPKAGLLIDFLGNLKKSAQSNLPIYRLSGGAGYVWSASHDQRGKGHLRFLAVDASALGREGAVFETANREADNLTSELSTVNQSDAVQTPSAEPEADAETTSRVYLETLHAHVARHTINPQTQFEGNVVVEFAIDKSGNLRRHKIVKSSGNEALDNAAITSLTNAEPFPHIPEVLNMREIELSVPFNFTVSESQRDIAAQKQRDIAAQKQRDIAALEEVAREAPKFLDEHPSDWSYEDTLDKMTGERIPLLKSIQSNDQDVIAEVTGRCNKPSAAFDPTTMDPLGSMGRVTFTALIVDSNGEPTITLADTLVRNRINHTLSKMLLAPKEFSNQFEIFVALGPRQREMTEFEQGLGLMQLMQTGGLQRKHANYNQVWGVLVEFKTNKGDLVVSLPIHHTAIQKMFQNCFFG